MRGMQSKGYSSLKFNSVINVIRSILSLLFPLITFKYVSNVLGPDGVGTAGYVSSIICLFQAVSSFSIKGYAIVEGAKLRRNEKEFERFFNSMITINFISFIVGYSFLLIVLSTDFFAGYKTYLLIYSIVMIFDSIGIEWFYIIYERYTYITIRTLVIQILTLICLFIFIKNPEDIGKYIALSAIAVSGNSIFNYINSRKYIRFRFVRYREWKSHFLPMLTIWAMGIASLIYVNSDITILGYLRSTEEVGYYSAAVKVIKAACIPIASITAVVTPRLSESIGSNDHESFESLVRKTFHVMLFLIIPIIIGIFLLSNESIILLSGPDYLVGVLAEKILLIDIFLSPINGFLAYQILLPLKKQMVSFYATLFGMLSNVVMDIVLIPRFSLYGVAFATVLSEFVVFVVCLLEIRKHVTFSKITKGSYKYFIAGLAVALIVCLSKMFTTNIYLVVIISVLLSSIFYYLVLIILKNEVVMDINKIMLRKIKLKMLD